MNHLLLLLSFLCLFHTLSAQEWTVKSSLPEDVDGRNHPVTFAIGGLGFVGLGQDDGYNELGDMYRYDAQEDSWTAMPDFAGGARSYAYGVSHGVKAYIGFGSSAEGDLNDLWEYNPLSGEAVQLASMPTSGRTHPTMVESGGIIYVGLGGSDDGDLDDWWAYSIAEDSWTELAQFPGDPRHHPYFFAIDGLIYTGFGHGEDIYRDWYQYDPATDEWTQLNDIPAEGRVAGTQFDFEGKGYVLSGQGESHGNLTFGEFWEYDPSDDSWIELEPHPGTGRWAPGSFIIENQLYFTCGESFSNEGDLWSWELAPLEPVSIEPSASFDLTLFPNPSKGIINVEASEVVELVEVYNALGVLLTSYQPNTAKFQLEVEETAGLCIMQLTSSGQVFRTQLLIK